MRILVISDIHANLTALETVLEAAGNVDGVWCLGDLIGYGPDINEVVERIRALPNLICMAGNHDVAISDPDFPIEMFNPHARRSVQMQREILSESARDFLRSLPKAAQIIDGVTLAHGSPRDSIWEYILTPSNASQNFAQMSTPCAFVGHTHVALGFEALDEDRIRLQPCLPERVITMAERRLILNPGSVGQPRDEDPRAAYAIYDPEAQTWTPYRITYDVAAVQERMRRLKLPKRHIKRLQHGW